MNYDKYYIIPHFEKLLFLTLRGYAKGVESMKWQIVAGICLLLLAVATAEAQNYVYFVPQNGNNPECSGTVEVEVWMHVDEECAGGQMEVEYDPAVIDVTWTRNTDAFRLGTYDSSTAGEEWITFMIDATGLAGDPQSPVTGDVLIGTLTIECVDCDVQTVLHFDLLKDDNDPIHYCVLNKPWTGESIEPTEWIDGTFTCGKVEEEEECLGDCYDNPGCTGDIIAEDVPCYECIAMGGYWKPNKDPACFDDIEPFDICLNWCPECCNGKDDDGDQAVDYPNDPQCVCGLDPSEEELLPPIPELLTLALVGAGAAAIVVWRRL